MNFKILNANTLIILGSLFFGITSCKQIEKKEEIEILPNAPQYQTDSLFFDLSLAQWSLHTLIYNGELDPLDFAETASEMGFSGIEYVSGFYADSIKTSKDPQTKMQVILDTLKIRSDRYGVRNVLIMIDGEGDLAVNDSVERNTSVNNHKKWVDAANYLGCHSIRVNLFGSNIPEEWTANSIDALTKLSNYASEKNINVLVENHGYLSSNADLLVEVIKKVNMENCGTLPDFGNFCLQRQGGERWDTTCIEEYPRYEGVEKMMPYAKAVSAKSYSFNEEGREELIDYKKMLKIIKNEGYNGFIGVEFEGTNITAREGIMKTKELLIEAARNL
ncbi:MAG: sugar phosphate isomerase/epimerase [Gramella sp.]|nr:sugar phosphate isomerase/epimerase [Christiangramia sp.]